MDDSDVAEQLRDLADSIESDDNDESLPVFNGYKMVERKNNTTLDRVYVDEEDDVWIEDRNGDDAICLDGSTRHVLLDVFDIERDMTSLPVFNGYQMVHKLYDGSTARIWKDEDGDVWVEDLNGDGAACLDDNRREIVEDNL
jgi:hypothetical protein